MTGKKAEPNRMPPRNRLGTGIAVSKPKVALSSLPYFPHIVLEARP
jgi:hypothetical protein